MKRIAISLTVAALAALTVVAAVSAAGPTPTPTPAAEQVQARDTLPAILGLSQAQIMELRHDGLSLAQIADRQKVDSQKLIDALVAQWGERIDARVTNGALTTAEAATLRAQLAVQAKATVNQVTLGGMRGAAVGAGPGAAGAGNGAAAGRGAGMAAGGAQGAGHGMGAGNGLCDGTGPRGAATP